MTMLWIFDNDGTLYNDTATELLFSKMMVSYVSRVIGVIGASHQETRRVIDDLKRKHETHFAAAAVAKEFSLEFREVVRETYLGLDLEECGIPSQDTERKKIIENLPGKKIVFTSNPSAFARLILNHIGLLECFDSVVGIEETQFFVKPDRRAFAIVHELFSPRHPCVFFCDDNLANLEAGAKFGWHTIWYHPVGERITGSPHAHIRSFSELEELEAVFLPQTRRTIS